MTSSMRENAALQEKRIYNYTNIRIRLPDSSFLEVPYVLILFCFKTLKRAPSTSTKNRVKLSLSCVSNSIRRWPSFRFHFN